MSTEPAIVASTAGNDREMSETDRELMEGVPSEAPPEGSPCPSTGRKRRNLEEVLRARALARCAGTLGCLGHEGGARVG